MELHINVTNKVATYRLRDGDIVCGNSDYTIRFAFDEEWDGIIDLKARFIWNGVYQDQPIVGGICHVPTLHGAEEVQVGVYGGALHTTTPAVIKCHKSILCDDPEINTETGKDYENILTDLVRQAEAAAQRAENAAQRAEAAGGTDTVRYTITSNLANVTSTNASTIIAKGGTYSATLIANGGIIDSVSVVMGGEDITSSAYTASNHRIVIQSVTGDLIITAHAIVPNVYTITNNLTNVTSNNSVTSVEEDEMYTTLLLATVGNIKTVTVTMGGVDITSTAYSSTSDRITIAKVTGDVVITAVARESVYHDVTYNLTNVTSGTTSSRCEDGTTYATRLYTDVGYTFTVSVTMGGVDITDSVYDTGNQTITISNVTGDIVITAVGEAAEVYYSVSAHLTNVGANPVIPEGHTVLVGSQLFTTLTSQLGGTDTFTAVTVTMGGVDVTSTAVRASDTDFYYVSIGSVTGNVVITATAE